MHSILLALDIPDIRDDTRIGRWRGLLLDLESRSKGLEGLDRLAENVWLLDASSALSFLGALIHGAEDIPTNYRALFLDAAPNWIPGPKDV
jgi:hypothetical protein